MERTDYAKQINWTGTATRIIGAWDIEEYKVGEIINPGLCWTDGGEFNIENDFKYYTVFEIVENTEGHEVDYENEDECYDLGCEECEDEKEILINKNFEIIEVWEYDEETNETRVFLKEVK